MQKKALPHRRQALKTITTMIQNTILINLTIAIPVLYGCYLAIRSSAVERFMDRNYRLYEHKASQNKVGYYYLMDAYRQNSPSFFKLLFTFKSLKVENFYTQEQINYYFNP